MATKSNEELGDQEGAAPRRRFVAGAVALGAGLFSGCGTSSQKEAPPVERSASTTIHWKVQSHVGGDTATFRAFKSFCESVGALSEGQLVLEAFPPGGVVGSNDLFDGLKAGRLDAAMMNPAWPADKHPELAFLVSYPLGLDRPDQWETWYYALGGLELARRMLDPLGIHFVAPIQHDLNIIHSRVPIRSFEDFRGKRLRMPGGLVADVFTAAGAKCVFTTADQVYPALANGAIDAADFTGPAVNYALGFANVAKYIIMGPPATPCIHQPCDLFALLTNMERWQTLPKKLQLVVDYAARSFSWKHYAYVQKENTLSWDKYKAKGIEILRLSDADVNKFRRIAIPEWFKWGNKSALAREAFASQLDFMKSRDVDYLTDSMLVDETGRKLTLQ
jgi:TRAP-type mannitol/chloroaromatic compound transport system substrate-binding protein